MAQTSRQLALVLMVAVLQSGCAATKTVPAATHQDYFTTREFAAGVAAPALESFATLGAFYCEGRNGPETQQALEAFAEKEGEGGIWTQVRVAYLSETPEDIVWRVSLVAPASLSANGELPVSWRLGLKKVQGEKCSLRVTIAPESRFCVRGESSSDLTAIGLFVDLAVRLISKAAKVPAPASASQSTPIDLCFDPSSRPQISVSLSTGEEPVKAETRERARKRLEDLLRR